VSSSRGSLPEILGDAALYFDPSSISQLLESVRTVLRNSERKKMMQERGYRQVARYHFRDMALLTLSIYQIALKNKTIFHDTPSFQKK